MFINFSCKYNFHIYWYNHHCKFITPCDSWISEVLSLSLFTRLPSSSRLRHDIPQTTSRQQLCREKVTASQFWKCLWAPSKPCVSTPAHFSTPMPSLRNLFGSSLVSDLFPCSVSATKQPVAPPQKAEIVLFIQHDPQVGVWILWNWSLSLITRSYWYTHLEDRIAKKSRLFGFVVLHLEKDVMNPYSYPLLSLILER